jgi:ABC-type Zn uptake system ZnuABC Zn-binding protein ZnuA
MRPARRNIQIAASLGLMQVARHRWVLAVVAAVGLGSAACANTGAATAAADTGKLAVVSTVAPITSIVSNVVGDRASVRGLVPEGTNSHTFEPKPSAAAVLAKADVVYVNGLQLEDPTQELAKANLKKGAAIVELGSRTITPAQYIYDFSFPKAEGKPNPHLWTDPTLARRYAEVVKDDMVARDPTNAAYYRENYARFASITGELDAAMRTAFATVPVRKLLTYHDAYAYFAKTYGWDVIGAIQVSDFEDPTPKEVAALIEQVRAEKVPAIFGSEVFPSPVLAAIGKEASVKYVDTLRDDDLPGKPGENAHSWLGLMRFDYIAMTEALGGDASALRAVVLRNAAPDKAIYPQ